MTCQYIRMSLDDETTHASELVTLDLLFWLASATEATLVDEHRQVLLHLVFDHLDGLLEGIL